MNNSSLVAGISWSERLQLLLLLWQTHPKSDLPSVSLHQSVKSSGTRYWHCTSPYAASVGLPRFMGTFLTVLPNVPFNPRFCTISSVKCCLIYDHFQLPCSSWPAGHKDSFMHGCNSHTHWHRPQQLLAVQKYWFTHHLSYRRYQKTDSFDWLSHLQSCCLINTDVTAELLI